MATGPTSSFYFCLEGPDEATVRHSVRHSNTVQAPLYSADMTLRLTNNIVRGNTAFGGYFFRAAAVRRTTMTRMADRIDRGSEVDN